MKERLEEGKIVLGGREIRVEVRFKRIKRVYFRPARDGGIAVSAPYAMRFSDVLSLIKKSERSILSLLERSTKEDGCYLFGKKVDAEPGEAERKRLLLAYLREAVASYEGKIGVFPPYAVKVRKMKTRLGSNSRRSHALTFALSLSSYDPHIIDSVVVHELCHHFYFDHGRGFHILLKSEFPDYERCRKKLIKGDFVW